MNAETVPVPSTLSQIQRSSAHIDLQPIAADYYNITDASGSPVAGLLVLLDRRHRPVRAELQLHDKTVGPLQQLAQRQSSLLIGDRYTGDHPLPLSVVRSRLEEERISVPLAAPAPPSKFPRWGRPLLLGALALLFFTSAGWLLNDFLSDTRTEESTAPAVIPGNADEAEMPASSSESPADRIFETNGLPSSRNAIPLEVGERVRIRPGLQVTLRSEAGASAGTEVGYMQSGMEAIIINGPVWLEGNSDTIVWWLVRLDNGTEAWVAANTSELTLLEPVP